jgi:myo-inositol 2-dehydrogenase / D-chiro-inositol 1-dehydrogenase
MDHRKHDRRNFLRCSATAIGSLGFVPYVFTANAEEAALPKAKNDRLRLGVIGLRYQGSVIARHALPYGDIVALCDVDANVLSTARAAFGSTAKIYEDYRKLLNRKDIDVVLIGTPDHWHAPMLIDACRAGKDVYCEKPLTLTIDEGKQIARVVEQTKRIVQVGSWQRSDARYRLAAEMVHAGRLGKIRKITVVLGKNKQGGPFASSKPHASFNWNLWQGQTPDVPYIPERTHYTFRWWYEYAGGLMTDWGAHHLDIAQWILGHDQSGPVEIDSRATFPDAPNGFNVAKDFSAKYVYADGAEIEVLDIGRNGLLIEGDKGRIFVSRGTLSGKPVEQVVDDPLPRDRFQLYDNDNLTRPERSGKLDAIVNHMGNFYDCLQTRTQPISDVLTQHRSATVCHLANISMRLKRKLRWNPETEQFVGDDEAGTYLSRPQRKGFEFSG